MMNYGGVNTGWIILCMAAGAVIVALVVWVIVRAGNQPGSRAALETLERRLASGEIDDQEYARRRALLLQH